MLDYGWGNPSSLLLTADQTGPDPEPAIPVFDPQNFSTFINPEPHFHLPFLHPNPHFPTFYDGAAAYPHHQPPSTFMKTEPVADFNARIGLNLGGRTYFASSDDDFVNRLYRRSRMLDPGSLNSPICQAEGCNADLTHAKHYHRRHKVCEFHSKAATAVVAGLAQRFCQQCSRFHSLTEFDNGKRSCRKRLDDHNRRRRKSHQTNNNNNINNNQESCSNKFRVQVQPKSPPDSGQHSSSVTVAISPARISFGSYAGGPTSSSTSSTGYTLY